MIHNCVKHGRAVCVWCIAQSMAFPVEHFLWERAPLLSTITRALGL